MEVNTDYNWDEINKTYSTWINSPNIDSNTKEDLALIESPLEITERFCHHLEFGTGGLRGIMAAGINRMNKYVVRRATSGLANYLLSNHNEKDMQFGVAIAFDSRQNSAVFAKESALTLCEYGIPVYLFMQPVPTPVLAFAVQQLHCLAGIAITASHNPKEYNGYKVYNCFGGQFIPTLTDELSHYINQIDDITCIKIMEEKKAVTLNLLHYLDDKIMGCFCNAVVKQAHNFATEYKKQITVVYTPLHGSGGIPVCRVLEHQGYKVAVVTAQELPDGNFPTVQSPNPEDSASLFLGIELAEEVFADVVLGTDPDCDRVGVAVRHGGEYIMLNGNQIGVLLVDYILRQRSPFLKPTAAIIKTVVTSELGAEIAKTYGLRVINTLTGFKYIGEQARLLGETNFVIGYEESCGYLVGTHVFDKDAVVSSMLICEMVAVYKAQNKSLVDVLEQLYNQYGFYFETMDSFVFQGIKGRASISAVMQNLRAIGTGLADGVEMFTDYLYDNTGLPKTDMLKYWFVDNSWMAVRPSGTEPKIKIYYSIKSTHGDIRKKKKDSRKKYENLHQIMEKILSEFQNDTR